MSASSFLGFSLLILATSLSWYGLLLTVAGTSDCYYPRTHQYLGLLMSLLFVAISWVNYIYVIRG